MNLRCNQSFSQCVMDCALRVIAFAVTFFCNQALAASEELTELTTLETLEAAEKEIREQRISRAESLLDRIQNEASLELIELIRYLDLKAEFLLRKENFDEAETLNIELLSTLDANGDFLDRNVIDLFRQSYFTRKGGILENRLDLAWSRNNSLTYQLSKKEKEVAALAIQAYKTALAIPEGIRSKDKWWEINTHCSLTRLLFLIEHHDFKKDFDKALDFVFKKIRDLHVAGYEDNGQLIAFRWTRRLCLNSSLTVNALNRLKLLEVELKGSASKFDFELAYLRLTISELELQIGNSDSAKDLLRLASVTDNMMDIEKAVIQNYRLAQAWILEQENSEIPQVPKELDLQLDGSIDFSPDQIRPDSNADLELAFEYVDTCRLLQQICLDAGKGRPGLKFTERIYTIEKKLGSANVLTEARYLLVKATHLSCLREIAEAKKLFELALSKFPNSKRDTLEYGIASNNYSSVCLASADWESAKRFLTNARKIMVEKLQSYDFRLAELYSNEGLLSASQADYAEGVSRYATAIEICERSKVESSKNAMQRVFFVTLLLNASQLERRQGKNVESDVLADRASRLLQKESAPVEQTLTCRLLLANIVLAKVKSLKDSEQKNRHLKSADQLLKEVLACEGLATEVYAVGHYLRGMVEYYLYSIGYTNSLEQAEYHWNSAWQIASSKGLNLLEARILLQWLRSMIENAKSFNQREEFAQRLGERLFQLQEELSGIPGIQFASLETFALLKRRMGLRSEARKLLQDAIDVAKDPRSSILAGDNERADYWARYSSGFDRLFEWTVYDSQNNDQELLSKAVRISDSKRSLTYLDQLRAKGLRLDERIERDAPELFKLRKKLSFELAQLLDYLRTSDGTRDFEQLGQRIEDIQLQRVKLEQDIQKVRNLYHNKISWGIQQEPSSDIRDLITRGDGTEGIASCIYYHIGIRSTFTVLAQNVPSEENVTISAFTNVVNDDQAALLGIRAGDLGEESACVIVNKVIELLTQENELTPKQKKILKSASEVILPPKLQDMLCNGPSTLTLVVSDGPLHRLPFDSLLVDHPNGDAPIFFLEHPACPAFFYCPSIAIYEEISRRSPASEPWKAVTIGNPKYDDWNLTLSRLPSSSAAYLVIANELPELRESGVESDQVKESLENVKRISRVDSCLKEDANEVTVTAAIEDAQIIHIAAHGAVNESFENLFGGIILSPNLGVDMQDSSDGVLTLMEIEELSLDRCQLAILSACKTNCGPERPLEAGSTLSRAFITAGAKRVICSQWNLDDATAALTVSTFMDSYAEALNGNRKIPHPRILLEAKKECRKQHPHPRFWAPMILIGVE